MDTNNFPFIGFCLIPCVADYVQLETSRLSFTTDLENRLSPNEISDFHPDVNLWIQQLQLAHSDPGNVFEFDPYDPSQNRSCQIILRFHSSFKLENTTSIILRYFCTILYNRTDVCRLMHAPSSLQWTIDLTDHSLVVSDAYARYFGFEKEEFPKDHRDFERKFFHPDDLELLYEKQKESIESSYFHDIELRHLRKDGSYIWIASTICGHTPGDQTENRTLSGFIRDIDDRKALEQSVLKEKKILERLIECAPFGVFKGSSTATNYFINRAYTEITGLTREDATGDGWRRVFLPEDVKAICEAWRESESKNKHFYDNIHLIRTVSGEEKYCHVFWNFDQFPDSTEGSLGALFDVTSTVSSRLALEKKTKELSEALNLAEKSTKSKSDFLAMISHEIRTPLNGIIGMVQLLTDSELSQDQYQMLKTIDDCGNSLLELINDVLEFSKIESGQIDLDLQPIRLKDIFNSTVNIFKVTAAKKDIDLIFECESDLPAIVLTDGPKLRRVLINLISNAIKFTQKGSVKVKCSTKTLEDDRVALSTDIVDTGIGMDDGGLARLFLPFSQVDSSISRKFGGTGLGLFLSKRIIDTMGGQIEVRSLLGQGTHFSFRLVFKKPPEMVDSLKKGEELHSLSNDSSSVWSTLDVLLVEDNEINRRLAVRILNKLGITPHVACDGFQGVKAVNQHIYHLILMDLSMPGMSGLEAARKIREDLPSFYLNKPVIVAMTANALDKDRELCFEIGMDAFISKPFKVDDLKRALNLAAKHR